MYMYIHICIYVYENISFFIFLLLILKNIVISIYYNLVINKNELNINQIQRIRDNHF